MKFLLFNLIVAVALVYLFSNDEGRDDTTGRLANIAKIVEDTASSATSSIKEAMVGHESNSGIKGTDLDTDPDPEATPNDFASSKIMNAGSRSVSVASSADDLALADPRSEEAGIDQSFVTTIPRKNQSQGSEDLPAADTGNADDRPSHENASFRIVPEGEFMKPGDRQRELVSLAQKMELLFVERAGE